MTTYANKYVERVACGIERLDEKLGEFAWQRGIDPYALAIDDYYLCVLAQLFGNYGEGFRELGLGSKDEAIACGFEVDDLDNPDELTQAWLDVL
jgi:hypothetical protein